MIYTGQNNGNPWGPVGENASVNGENFPANQQLRLVLVEGDSNNGPAICKTPLATANSTTTDSAGKFAQNFFWPVATDQVNKEYSICALRASDGSIVSSHDDGPFTVLAASPPVINISSTTVTVGSTLTVTGHSWVPPQPVNINIAGCADCEPGSTEVANTVTTSGGLNDGTFSVTIPIPASIKTGTYVVNAFTPSGMDANYIPGSGIKQLTINGAATSITTATPTLSTTPTATATAIATSTSTATTIPTATAMTVVSATNTNTSNANGSDNGSSGLMIVLFIALAVILLTIAGAIIFMLLQRSASGKRPTIATRNHGQLTQTYGRPASNAVYPVQQGGPQGIYSQLQQLHNSSPTSGQSPMYAGRTSPNFGNYAQNQPTQQYVSAPEQVYNQPTQTRIAGWPLQQNSSAPVYNNQSVPRNVYDEASTQMSNTFMCANCGRTLAPDDIRCDGCGSSVGTQSSNFNNPT
ncbi:MAG: hypothetical protein NVS4B7_09820 [Ktedonobacteraceae bacterium]